MGALPVKSGSRAFVSYSHYDDKLAGEEVTVLDDASKDGMRRCQITHIVYIHESDLNEVNR